MYTTSTTKDNNSNTLLFHLVLRVTWKGGYIRYNYHLRRMKLGGEELGWVTKQAFRTSLPGIIREPWPWWWSQNPRPRGLQIPWPEHLSDTHSWPRLESWGGWAGPPELCVGKVGFTQLHMEWGGVSEKNPGVEVGGWLLCWLTIFFLEGQAVDRHFILSLFWLWIGS
jgi:hypothetical protein